MDGIKQKSGNNQKKIKKKIKVRDDSKLYIISKYNKKFQNFIIITSHHHHHHYTLGILINCFQSRD